MRFRDWWGPHWLLRDPELLEEAKRLAAKYVPEWRKGEILAHNFDASYDQGAFRFGDAGSSLGSPTWEAAESVDLVLEQDGVGDYALQVWISVLQTDDRADLLRTKGWRLQASLNGAAFVYVDDASDFVDMIADSGFADGDAISSTQVSGAGGFISGEAQETNDQSDDITFTQDALSYTNLCWSVNLVDANIPTGQTVDFRVVETDGTLVANDSTSDKPRITWNAPPPVVNWGSFRLYKDGTESGSTPLDAEDTDITLGFGDWFHYRASVTRTATGGSRSIQPAFEFRRNGGGWFAINTISARVRVVDSVNFTNESATTDRATDGLTDAGTTFVAGHALDTAGASVGTIALNNNEFTECLISLYLAWEDFNDGDTVDLKMTDNGVDFDDWTGSAAQLATITIHKPKAQIRRKPGYRAAPLRTDGVWHGLEACFAQLDPEGVELVRGIRPTTYDPEGAFQWQYGDFGPEWAVADGLGTIEYQLGDPAIGRHETTTPDGEYEYEITTAVLLKCSSTALTPESNHLFVRYNGVAGDYVFRMRQERSDARGQVITFSLQLDGADRETHDTIYMPEVDEYFWVVARWQAGEKIRCQIFDTNGYPVTAEANSTNAFNGPIQYAAGDADPDDDYYSLWGDSNSSWEDAGVAAFGWRRFLNDEHLRTFFQDPWGFYAPVPLAAAAGITESVGTAPVIVHAPGTTQVPGAVTRAATVAPLVVHAPDPSLLYNQEVSAGPAPLVAHAPGVGTAVGAVLRAATVAALIFNAPAVATAAGAVSRTVDSAPLVAHAPAVTLAFDQEVTVGAAPYVFHAPGVAAVAGAVSRTVEPGVLIVSTPSFEVNFDQETDVGTSQVVFHTPAVAASSGATTRAVGVAPLVVHAPAVTTQTGAVARVVESAPAVLHTPAVQTDTQVSRAVGTSQFVLHTPAVTASLGATTKIVASAPLVVHTPAVATQAGAVARLVDSAPAVLHAPAVQTATGAVARVVGTGQFVLHTPSVETAFSESRTVGSAQLIAHSPAVTTQTGNVIRIVGVAPAVLHAPAVTLSFNQETAVGVAPLVVHAPAVLVSGGNVATVASAVLIVHAPATTQVFGQDVAAAAASLVAHAPDVATQTAVTRAVGTSQLVAHAPAVVTASTVSRVVGSAPAVFHTPAVVVTADNNRTVGTSQIIVHAPAVSIVGDQLTAVGAASAVLHAPAVATTTGAVTRAVGVAPYVFHAPAVTTVQQQFSQVDSAPAVLHTPGVATASGGVSRSVGSAPAVFHAPSVATATGVVSRLVDSAHLVAHTPGVTALNTFEQTRALTEAGATVFHTPAVTVSQRTEPCPPLSVLVTSTETSVSCISTLTTVTVSGTETFVTANC